MPILRGASPVRGNLPAGFLERGDAARHSSYSTYSNLGQMWTSTKNRPDGRWCPRHAGVVVSRNSTGDGGLYNTITDPSIERDGHRAPRARVLPRVPPRMEVNHWHRRGPAGSASPRPSQSRGTTCRAPGHEHHALAARGPFARERVLRCPAGHHRVATSPRLHAEGEGPRSGPRSPEEPPGLLIGASWAIVQHCPGLK